MCMKGGSDDNKVKEEEEKAREQIPPVKTAAEPEKEINSQRDYRQRLNDMEGDIQMQYLGLSQASPAPNSNQGNRSSTLNSTLALQVRSKHMMHYLNRYQSPFSIEMCEKNKLTMSHECSICLTRFELGDNVVELRCDKSHIFHKTCLTTWTQ